MGLRHDAVETLLHQFVPAAGTRPGLAAIAADVEFVAGARQGDIEQAVLAKGCYTATVFLDKVEPMTARRVHFHFTAAS